ncbi:alkaline phosphatase family protein [Porphyromonas macacae]|uniref:alkaline phosphatase family protein n=1 Tax=Porphyromonas macacae TaxID=28115 RepID=UPI0024ACD8D3|nr:alkaline phosphatase family protein [Porphyromonas macacae]
MPRREQLSIKYLFASLLALLPLCADAQIDDVPKLLVCITADQLDPDVLEQIKPYLSENGFRRLYSQGFIHKNVIFPFSPVNRSSAVASIYSGTTPNVHGITGELIYDRSKNTSQPILTDIHYSGVYTRDALSPANVLSGMIGDELKAATNNYSAVFSVAANGTDAIAAGGVSADGAYWIDDKIAGWATSSFYPEMPGYLSQYNRSAEGPNQNIVSKKWEPLQGYKAISYQSANPKFKYFFGLTKIAEYKHSALINEEITTVAKKIIENGEYNRHREKPGVLFVTYYCGRSLQDRLYGVSPELIDTYIRLDRQLASLFSVLDSKTGAGKYLVSFTGTGYVLEPVSHTKGEERINRVFSSKKMKTLVDLYLKAIYGGNEEWVKAITAEGVFLNRKQIEHRKLNLVEVQQKVAELIREMDGVKLVATSSLLNSGVLLNDDIEKLRLSTHTNSCPDIVISFLSGWQTEVEGVYSSTSNSSQQKRITPLQYRLVQTPFILMGAGIPHKVSDLQIRVTQIAPTLSGFLKIRAPNSAFDKAVEIK